MNHSNRLIYKVKDRWKFEPQELNASGSNRNDVGQLFCREWDKLPHGNLSGLKTKIYKDQHLISQQDYLKIRMDETIKELKTNQK
jgi:hypothetical protein